MSGFILFLMDCALTISGWKRARAKSLKTAVLEVTWMHAC